MIQDIYIIDDKGQLIEQCKEIFKNEDFKFYTINCIDLDVALKNIPSMIIVDDDNTEMRTEEICQRIRTNEDNSITPIIVISSNADKNYRLGIFRYPILYYLLRPIDNDYFYYTVKNMIDFVTMNRRVSPLTGLPGNVQIQAEMKKRLLNREKFAVIYYDLDNFKAYNDVYGFSNGDEIIKFTAKTIAKHMHNLKDNKVFIGHIGGDDFVSIIERADYDNICKALITDFDAKIPEYYTEEDVERGFVEVANRKGIIEQFPLVTISIAVVEVDDRLMKTPLEIGEISAQVKHRAKTMIGSTYVINQRKF